MNSSELIYFNSRNVVRKIDKIAMLLYLLANLNVKNNCRRVAENYMKYNTNIH